MGLSESKQINETERVTMICARSGAYTMEAICADADKSVSSLADTQEIKDNFSEWLSAVGEHAKKVYDTVQNAHRQAFTIQPLPETVKQQWANALQAAEIFHTMIDGAINNRNCIHAPNINGKATRLQKQVQQACEHTISELKTLFDRHDVIKKPAHICIQ
jgi:hypothetical protein